MADADPRVVLVTVPDVDCGLRLARALVRERLAACGNLVPGVTSVYRWQGAIQEEGEVLLVLKTLAGQLEALEQRLTALHPYDVPEFVAIEPAQVAAPYLAWLRDAIA